MNYVAMHIGQSSLDSVVIVGEPLVIDSKQMQDGGVKVIDSHGVPGRLVREFVGLAEADSRLQPRAGHPRGEDVRMMVATESRTSGFRERCTAELG